MSLISIVVPVYHNAPSLPDLLSRFQTLADQNAGDQFEFVFVDDGSADNSFEVLQQLSQSEPRMVVVKLSRNFGSNPAIIAGMAHTKGDAVAAISADLQDPPELIHDMLIKWRAGNKVVLATREGRDDAAINNFMSDTFYSLFKRYAIKTMPQRGFDFFLIDRRVCDLINDIEESNPYLMGLILWMGFNPVVLPYHRREREKKYGTSMWSLAKKVKYFIDSFVAFSYMPVRVTSLIGFLFSGIGLLYAVIVVALRIFYGAPVEGWSSLMVVVLVVSGIQMIMLGIQGEYTWRNLDETRHRPRFIVEKIVHTEQPVETSEPVK